MRDLYRLRFIVPLLPLPLVAVRHQDRVIHGRAQLYRTQNDAGDERQFRPRIIRYCHIDKDGEFDDELQDRRQRQRAEHQHDDHKNDPKRHGADIPEVNVCDAHHILCQRCLPDDHGVRIILMYDRVDLIDLLVDLVHADVIPGADEGRLISAPGQFVEKICGQHGLRNGIADEGTETEVPAHAVQIPDPLQHGLLILHRKFPVHQDHMHRTRPEILFDRLCGDLGWQIVGKGR